jgi:hypothetical protein
MPIRCDEQTTEAVKRLRLQDDFKRVVSTLEDQYTRAAQLCTVVGDSSHLRQQQGRAQQLHDVLEWLRGPKPQ